MESPLLRASRNHADAAGRRETAWTWRRAATADDLPGKKTWDQLARCWAASAAEYPAACLTDEERSNLTARYHPVDLFTSIFSHRKNFFYRRSLH